MNYSKVLSELQEASLFDLFRLKSAIERELDNPVRLNDVRKRIHVGQTVHYFEKTENRLVEAKVLELNRTRILVENIEDGHHWTMPFYMLNLDNCDTDVQVKTKKGIDRNSLKYGDLVGFQDRNNNELFGKVIQLNPKTVVVLVNDSHKWKLSYSLLYPIIDVSAQEDGKGRWVLE